MNYEDFRSGDIVLIEGSKRLVIKFRGNLVIVGENQYQPLDAFLEAYKSFSVYRADSNYSLSSAIFDDDVDLDYKGNFEKIHDGSAVKEVTLEEVAEQFGVDVKKIRIKE